MGGEKVDGNSEHPAEKDDLQPTRKAVLLGKYKLVAKIGRGGMADVFLAVAQGPAGFNKLVVIKRLLPQYASDPSVRQMFLDEARLAARLNHPNVVQTFEIGEQNDFYYIAMEYLEGQSLRGITRAIKKSDERLDPVLSARIISEVLRGLHYAHELKDFDGTPLHLVHRDVSPQNVFVTYDGHVKLVDFGVAKAATRSTHTEFGVIKGKAAYMAPEQAMGNEVDRRADIFAAGVVLWELLTAKRLFAGKTSTASLVKLINFKGAEPVTTYAQDVPEQLNDIVLRALAPDPDNRYQTAKEMRSALDDFVTAHGNVKQEELSEWMDVLFSEVRERRAERIKAEMARITNDSMEETGTFSMSGLQTLSMTFGSENSGAGSPGEMSMSGSNSLSLSQSGSGSLRLSGSGSGSGQSPALVAGAPEQHKSNKWMVPVVLLLAVVGVGVALWRPWATAPTADSKANITASLAASTATESPKSTATETATEAPTATAQPDAQASANENEEEADADKKADKKAHKTSARWLGHRAASKHAADTKGKDAGTPKSAAPEKATEKGFLAIDSSPWARVTVAGRSLGTTPLGHIPLPPGTYAVTLVNSEKGLSKTITVTIKAGKTSSRRVLLQ